MKYKVAYLTSSRADFGIVENLLHLLDKSDEIDLTIVAFGSHFISDKGNTIDYIKNQSFSNVYNLDNQTKQNICNSITNNIDEISLYIKKFNEFFDNNYFDSVIILGDRYEMIAPALVCAMRKIPIIHFHGGEKTIFNFDEFIRHSISKMSNLHIVATQNSYNRLKQLGESNKFILNLGSLSCDYIHKMDLKKTDYVLKKYNLIHKKFVLLLYHSETLNLDKSQIKLSEILKELYKDLSKDIKILFFSKNTDVDYDDFKLENNFNNDRLINLKSVSHNEYLSLLYHALFIIGNSSSGIIEAPCLKTKTINIGNRQEGRDKNEQIINIKSLHLLKKALNKKIIFHSNCANPYCKKNTTEKAKQKIIKFLKSKNKNIIKNFIDIK